MDKAMASMELVHAAHMFVQTLRRYETDYYEKRKSEVVSAVYEILGDLSGRVLETLIKEDEEDEENA